MWWLRALGTLALHPVYFMALLLAVPAILIGAPVAVWAVNLQITQGRDPEAFFAYLGDHTDLEMTHAKKSEWLKLGDESCAWLADQPYPWFSRSDRFQHSGLESRFWRESPPPSEWEELDFDHDPQQWIVPSAWSRLCGDTWERHEPHNPFNRAPTD